MKSFMVHDYSRSARERLAENLQRIAQHLLDDDLEHHSGGLLVQKEMNPGGEPVISIRSDLKLKLPPLQ